MAETVAVKNIGLRGVTVADTAISFIDGEKGILIYRGYRIGMLRRAWKLAGEDFIECPGFGANAEILCKLRPLRPNVVEVPHVYRYHLAQGSSALHVGRTIREYFRLFGTLRSIPTAPEDNRAASP